jgi:HAD superfamily hydrolase (TIGR01509 family)
MISTLIFDLDGLLSDTEKLHRRAYRDALGEVGFALADSQYETHWIRDGRGIGEFIAEHGLDLDPEIVRSRKAAKYKEMVRAGAEAMPGALRALERFHPHKNLALGTSSYQEDASAVVKALGIGKYFTCIATKANVERVKPFPDIFLWVASTLGVPPSQCVVLEDAQKGIAAACAAGMRSIAIPNVHTRHNDFSKATLVLSTLDALTTTVLDELDRSRP